MSKKFGTVLDEGILSEAKAYCHHQRTSISHLIEEALREYLKQKSPSHQVAFSGVDASFGVLSVPSKTLRRVLEDDIYETQ